MRSLHTPCKFTAAERAFTLCKKIERIKEIRINITRLIDWTSRIEMKIFQDKSMMIMSASVGKNGGANVLKTAIESAPHFGARVLASFSVGNFDNNFNSETGQLQDSELAENLRKSLATLS